MPLSGLDIPSGVDNAIASFADSILEKVEQPAVEGVNSDITSPQADKKQKPLFHRTQD